MFGRGGGKEEEVAGRVGARAVDAWACLAKGVFSYLGSL